VAFDAEAGVVWGQQGWSLERFDPKTSTWSSGARDLYWNALNSNGVFDPTRRALVMVGTGENPRTFVYDITDPEAITGERLATRGDIEIELANAAGLSYDAIADRIVAWSGQPERGLDPANVYILDLDAATWTVQPPLEPDPVVPANALGQGTWGRFRYAPDYNVHVLVNRIDEPVMFYRVAEGPDPDPDPTGTGSSGGASPDSTGADDGSTGGTTGPSETSMPGSDSGSTGASSDPEATDEPNTDGGCACASDPLRRRPSTWLAVFVLAALPLTSRRRRKAARADGLKRGGPSVALVRGRAGDRGSRT
jgi:MYXO-CTERM domain-containing protein